LSLRLLATAIVAGLFLIAGIALGQPADGIRGLNGPPQDRLGLDGGQTHERPQRSEGADTATGSHGTTSRGSASGAADSPPADRARDAGLDDSMAEPTGPGSAERRPGTAVTQ
jgi:hypothetical protein